MRGSMVDWRCACLSGDIRSHPMEMTRPIPAEARSLAAFMSPSSQAWSDVDSECFGLKKGMWTILWEFLKKLSHHEV